jgi:hypothetical protein
LPTTDRNAPLPDWWDELGSDRKVVHVSQGTLDVSDHGGYGGVQYALSNGVPLIVGGATEDKPEVAARLRWAGVGIDLGIGKPQAAGNPRRGPNDPGRKQLPPAREGTQS